MRKEYYITFCNVANTKEGLISDNKIGCSSLMTESFYTWPHKLYGELFSGSYDEVLKNVGSNLHEPPVFIIVFAQTVIGFEDFIKKLQMLVPGIPFAGGAAAGDLHSRRLIPDAIDINLLAVYDNNFRIATENLYPLLHTNVHIKCSGFCKVSHLKLHDFDEWQTAATVYRNLQRIHNVPESNFEAILLSDQHGRNVHSVVDGEELITTADFSGYESISIRKATADYLTTTAVKCFSKTDTVFFACAGIHSMFKSLPHCGERTFAAYLYGEIGFFNTSNQLAGLSISYIEKK